MYNGTLLEFLNMGGGEIMLILVVVLLLFGGKKLPELARGLGKGIRDFKDASEGVKREIHRNINATGIADDIDSVINDTNNRYQSGAESGSVKEDISFEKKNVANEAVSTENSRIETDKTNL